MQVEFNEICWKQGQRGKSVEKLPKCVIKAQNSRNEQKKMKQAEKLNRLQKNPKLGK